MMRDLNGTEWYINFVDLINGVAVVTIAKCDEDDQIKVVNTNEVCGLKACTVNIKQLPVYTPFMMNTHAIFRTKTEARLFLHDFLGTTTLIEHGTEYEAYRFHEPCDSLKLVCIDLYWSKDYCAFKTDQGSFLTLTRQDIISMMQNNRYEFINIALDEDGNPIIISCDYTKYKTDEIEFVGVEHDPLWECIEKIKHLSDDQLEAVDDFLFDYYHSAEAICEAIYVVELFYTPEDWFPTMFWNLEESLQDLAFEIMEMLGICEIVDDGIIV